MNNTKSKFEVLVSKMKTLNETQQGKLKGGIQTLSSIESTYSDNKDANYLLCGGNGYCPQQPTKN